MLLQTENKLNLEATEAGKMAAFEMLDSTNQNQILSELHQGSGSHAEWGFLKNIINIDTFFAAGAGGKGCKSACSYKDHYKKLKDEKDAKEKARLEKEKADAAAHKSRKQKEEDERKEAARIKKEKEDAEAAAHKSRK